VSTVYSVDVRVTAPVNDTEVTDRVIDAIRNLFPGAEIGERPGRTVAETHSLDHLSERLREQAILDTARTKFYDGLQGDTFEFRLKKQAAFAGVVNFAVGAPDELGDLSVEVRVREPDPSAYIDYVAPPTEEGVPIDEREGDTGGDGGSGPDDRNG
jgi:predicted RNA binding protein with dsRBD fold (UPF0201 family)